jgi:hypothetical protein
MSETTEPTWTEFGISVVADPASALSSCGRVARLLGGAPSQQVLGVTPVERQSASCQQVAGIILRLHRKSVNMFFSRGLSVGG